HEIRGADQRPGDRPGAHQLADSGSRMAEHRGAEGGQARELHGADGDEPGGVQTDRGSGEEDRLEIHDGRDGGVYARVSLHGGAARYGEAREAAVRAGEPSAGYGWVAELLARAAADVVCDALRGAGVGARGEAGGIRELLRVGDDSQGADQEVWV